MKNPKLTKDGKLPLINPSSLEASRMAADIEDLFIERLPNHTLSEVCRYIAGYIHRRKTANLKPEWQPIKTAPMDGTRILVAGPYLKEIEEQEPAFYMQVAYWDDGWVVDAFNPRRGGTHPYWMPLPEPPND